MKIIKIIVGIFCFSLIFCPRAFSESPDSSQMFPPAAIFDDKMLLDGYAERFRQEPKHTLLEMIKDDTLNPIQMAAAVRVFRERFIQEVFTREKIIIEKILIRRLNRTESAFVQVEIMHTLCLMDRYKYFKSMVPALIQKLDHYNAVVNAIAYDGLTNITSGHDKPREARIVFSTLRNVLFLSRKRLSNVKEPDERLTQKLKLLRWSIKILGNEELKKLPKEVINLL